MNRILRTPSARTARTFMPGHGASFARTAAETDTTEAKPAWADRTDRAVRRAAWSRGYDGRQQHGDRSSVTGFVGAVLVFVAMLGAFDGPTATPVQPLPTVTVTAEAPDTPRSPEALPAIALDPITVTAEAPSADAPATTTVVAEAKPAVALDAVTITAERL
jgi:hypothetical protein